MHPVYAKGKAIVAKKMGNYRRFYGNIYITM